MDEIYIIIYEIIYEIIIYNNNNLWDYLWNIFRKKNFWEIWYFFMIKKYLRIEILNRNMMRLLCFILYLVVNFEICFYK